MFRPIFLIALAATVASPASATDFTFDVPVSISNLPRVTRARIQCFVSNLPAGTDGWAAGDHVIGRSDVWVELTNGSYNGTVTVPVENSGILRSADARGYACTLTGSALNDSGAVVTLHPSIWGRTLSGMGAGTLERETTRLDANIP